MNWPGELSGDRLVIWMGVGGDSRFFFAPGAETS